MLYTALTCAACAPCSVALHRNGRDVYTWGRGDSGQLGAEGERRHPAAAAFRCAGCCRCCRCQAQQRSGIPNVRTLHRSDCGALPFAGKAFIGPPRRSKRLSLPADAAAGELIVDVLAARNCTATVDGAGRVVAAAAVGRVLPLLCCITALSL